MAPPDDPPPARPPRRRTELGPAEHPSGRWELERFNDDDEVTPPPVDPDSAFAWRKSRERITNLEVLFAGLKPEIESISRRVTGLESKDAEMSRSLIALEKSTALQTQSLTTIERGIVEIKASRDSDGARFRHVIQILASIAAIAVSVIAIATR